MSKPTGDMTKRELAQEMAGAHYTGDNYQPAVDWYMSHMTKHQLLEQVEHLRGERTQSELTYRYDH